MQSLFILLIGAALLAACATPSKAPAPSPQPTQSPAPPSQQTSPPPVAPAERTPTPATPSAPSAADKAQAQELALHAVNLLDEGREGEAKAELTKALSLDRNNVLADSLMSQIAADPAATLGTKSFRYTVRPGDTLSKIAEAFLKDQYKFYILARYNNIAVPRSLRVGQVIRVPGTEATLPSTAIDKGDSVGPGKSVQAEHLYQDGQQALRDGDKDKAYDLFVQSLRLEPKDQRPRAAAEQLKPELIALHDRKAREAFRRQDLNTTIKEWDRVLELDPNNETARLERQRAEELKKHLEGVN
jgi:tetratricopeptide (TPR) repeat protein